MQNARTPEELRDALRIQRRALEKSCQGYDDGETWEALRLATATYNLVHDSGNRNRSILTQLGIRESIPFLASGHQINPSNLLHSTPLVIFRIGGGNSGVIPRLAENPVGDRDVSFKAWWEREGIYRAGKEGRDWHRKNLVFSLRNQDGGSHFDTQLRDPDYLLMKAGAGWIMNANGREQPLKGVEFASMRQIAFELMTTLDRSGI